MPQFLDFHHRAANFPWRSQARWIAGRIAARTSLDPAQAMRTAAGDNPGAQAGEIWRLLGVPLLAIAAVLAFWAALAPQMQTSLGAIPGPAQVWTEAVSLHEDPVQEAQKERVFLERVEERTLKLIEAGRADEAKAIPNWVFDLETGQAVGEDARIATYPVRIENGRILLDASALLRRSAA